MIILLLIFWAEKMDKRVRTTPTLVWLEENHDLIEIDSAIKENVRGIYSFWTEKKCIYVGKAIDILSRLEEHFEKIKWLSLDIPLKDDAPKYIKVLTDSFTNGNKIYVKLEQKVDYVYDNYFRDLHRLAYQEYSIIEKYQEKGWCLYQKPEGSNNDYEENQWNDKFNELNNHLLKET